MTAPRPDTIRTGGASIDLVELTKTYGGSAVVDDINLSIQPGEFITFLGPSGSGKTTTLNMIAGFVDVTAGDLVIDGTAVTGVPAHKRKLGVVFQNYALFPHMSVRENIAYPLRRRRTKADEVTALTDAVLDMVQMSDFADRRPAQLSGGQQQRVALARALVYRPNVLLMDEPLAALDKKLREWLQGEIKRIHREVGSTFVFVTHDQEEALSMSDRIAVFNDGRIEQVGTARELYENPRSLFVGRFLGESTILKGKATADTAGRVVIDAGGVGVHAVGTVPGDTATLLVRPEKLRLLPVAAAPETDVNALEVTVTEVTYLGSGWRYEFELPGGGTGVARSTEAFGVERGERASLRWHPTSGVLVAETITPRLESAS